MGTTHITSRDSHHQSPACSNRSRWHLLAILAIYLQRQFRESSLETNIGLPNESRIWAVALLLLNVS
jgi:hypothetical protein